MEHECVICGTPVMSDEEYCDECRRQYAPLALFDIGPEADRYGIAVSY